MLLYPSHIFPNKHKGKGKKEEGNNYRVFHFGIWMIPQGWRPGWAGIFVGEQHVPIDSSSHGGFLHTIVPTR